VPEQISCGYILPSAADAILCDGYSEESLMLERAVEITTKSTKCTKGGKNWMVPLPLDQINIALGITQ
jgi:hypothetical protein